MVGPWRHSRKLSHSETHLFQCTQYRVLQEKGMIFGHLFPKTFWFLSLNSFQYLEACTDWLVLLLASPPLLAVIWNNSTWSPGNDVLLISSATSSADSPLMLAVTWRQTQKKTEQKKTDSGNLHPNVSLRFRRDSYNNLPSRCYCGRVELLPAADEAHVVMLPMLTSCKLQLSALLLWLLPIPP